MQEEYQLIIERNYQRLIDCFFPHFEEELKKEYKNYLLYGVIAPEVFENEDL